MRGGVIVAAFIPIDEAFGVVDFETVVGGGVFII
jgi:hypothetical protein